MQRPLRLDPQVPPPLPGDKGYSRHLARLLDTVITIPGTKLKIGLDPILGLIPGIGDTVATGMGALILLDAMRQGAPRLLLTRMAGNMLINGVAGAIPVVGDVFSAYYHSNTKNYTLLKSWQDSGARPDARGHGKWVLFMLAVLFLVLLGLCVLAVWLLAKLWQWVSG